MIMLRYTYRVIDEQYIINYYNTRLHGLKQNRVHGSSQFINRFIYTAFNTYTYPILTITYTIL